MKKNWIIAIICIISSVIIFTSFNNKTMKAKARLNHLAIYVKDLQTSTNFYSDLIGLDTIPEPFHDGRHTWIRIADGAALHIIAGAKADLPHDKNNHLCFTIESVESFVKILQQKKIPYENWLGEAQQITTRVDGVKQIWFRDPDGYWIEINDARD